MDLIIQVVNFMKREQIMLSVVSCGWKVGGWYNYTFGECNEIMFLGQQASAGENSATGVNVQN